MKHIALSRGCNVNHNIQFSRQIVYRAGGTGSAGDASASRKLGRNRSETFSLKRVNSLLRAPQDFQTFR